MSCNADYPTQVRVVQDSGGAPSGNQSYSQSVSFSGNQAVYLMGNHYMSSTSDYWIMIGASVGPVLDSSQWLFVPWTVAPAGSALTVDTNYVLPPSFAPATESLVPPVVFAGCAASMNPSPQASQTPPMTPTPSATPIPPAFPTPTLTPTPSLLPLPTTSQTPYPTPSPLSSQTPSLTSSPLPSPSPSPSGLPTLVGVTNMTANFDDAIATFNMSGAVPLGNVMSMHECCVLRVACRG